VKSVDGAMDWYARGGNGGMAGVSASEVWRKEKVMGNFYKDVLKVHQSFAAPARVAALELLKPETRDRVSAIIADAHAHGAALMPWETFRSRARQKVLYERGVTKLKDVGVHGFGLACDLVFDLGGGEPSWKGDFSLLGTLARDHGLIWGGDWGDPTRKHGFVDAVHVQRCPLSRQAALFREEWYPEGAYDPYDDR